jgi:hypothetical protein
MENLVGKVVAEVELDQNIVYPALWLIKGRLCG